MGGITRSAVVTIGILGGLSALVGCGELDDRVPSIVTPTPSGGAGGAGEPPGVVAGNEAGASGAMLGRPDDGPEMSEGGDPSAGDASASDTGMSETGGTEAAASSCSASAPCPPGASCTGGTCQCPGLQTACPEGCFDLQTDRQHCGSCSTSCRYSCGSGFCYTPIVVPTASANAAPFEFAVGATRVYYTEGPEPRRMATVLIDGTDFQNFSFGLVGVPASLMHAANSLYGVVQGNIFRLPLSGGSGPVELVTSPEDYALEPLDIAVSANYVVWINGGARPSIGLVPLEGGSVFSRSVIGSSPRALAIDDTYIYWTTDNIGVGMSVERATPVGGSPVVLASGLDRVVDLAVHAGQVYLVINSPNVQSLARVPSVGGGVTTLAAIHATCIAVDSTGIYLGGAGQFQDGVIHYSLDGQVETMLAGGAFVASSIQLDANNVYWSSARDGIRSTLKMP